MTYRVIKTIKGIQYLYEQESRREGRKVKSISKYIGRVSDLNLVNTTAMVLLEDINNMSLSNSVVEIQMALDSTSFVDFINGLGCSKIFPVGALSDEIVKELGATQNIIRLSAETAEKQKRVHSEVNHNTYKMVQLIVDNGETLSDKEKHLSFFYNDENSKIWYLVIKVTAMGEIYLQSFRRSNIEHKERIKNRVKSTKDKQK